MSRQIELSEIKLKAKEETKVSQDKKKASMM